MCKQRELTKHQRGTIRKLVKEQCANYNDEYGCLPLECECYMMGKSHTSAFCSYFEQAVMPLDMELTNSLSESPKDTKPCSVCGRPFPIQGRRLYCSTECREKAQRVIDRERVRRNRRKDG